MFLSWQGLRGCLLQTLTGDYNKILLIMNTLQWGWILITQESIQPSTYLKLAGKNLYSEILNFHILFCGYFLTWKQMGRFPQAGKFFSLVLMLSVQASFTTSGQYHFNRLTWFSYLQSCSRLTYPPHCHQCNLVLSCFESSGARQGLVLTLCKILNLSLPVSPSVKCK